MFISEHLSASLQSPASRTSMAGLLFDSERAVVA